MLDEWLVSRVIGKQQQDWLRQLVQNGTMGLTGLLATVVSPSQEYGVCECGCSVRVGVLDHHADYGPAQRTGETNK